MSMEYEPSNPLLWEQWFAWHPIVCEDGTTTRRRWLCWVWRYPANVGFVDAGMVKVVIDYTHMTSRQYMIHKLTHA